MQDYKNPSWREVAIICIGIIQIVAIGWCEEISRRVDGNYQKNWERIEEVKKDYMLRDENYMKEIRDIKDEIVRKLSELSDRISHQEGEGNGKGQTWTYQDQRSNENSPSQRIK